MRVQVVLDDVLGSQLQTKAHDLGFSVSSYVRYLVKQSLSKYPSNELDLAMNDLKQGNIEKITLDQFNKQTEGLY